MYVWSVFRLIYMDVEYIYIDMYVRVINLEIRDSDVAYSLVQVPCSSLFSFKNTLVHPH